ncbi:hypothetical protein MNBD_GAMMA12-2299 [hydrothermal vent metagenome]|uniref:Uncharacterized protein n=1 Tax=hydrothermal vent metagenome TaxID=652676 RepID=A0A3B0YCD3_9ZZZZ
MNVEANDYVLDIYDIDGDGISNADELLLESDPRVPEFVVGQLVRLRVAATIENASDAVGVNADALHVFVTLDSGPQQELQLDSQNKVSVDFFDLTASVHRLVLSYEYITAEGRLILSEIDRDINLTVGSVVLDPFEIKDFNVSSFDDDGDGTYNIDELLNNSNPRSVNAPIAPQLFLNYKGIKTFEFTWQDVGGPEIIYNLLENIDGISGFEPIASDFNANVQLFKHIVPLYDRLNAQYMLQSCNAEGCTNSEVISVEGNLIGSIGYFKHLEGVSPGGEGMALSGDGRTLTLATRGGVSVFNKIGGRWEAQSAILESELSRANSIFIGLGSNMSLSNDGLTLVIHASPRRVGGAVDVAGNVYVLVREGENWREQAFLQASNATNEDFFGANGLTLSADGSALVVGARFEDSNAIGINGDQLNTTAMNSGAVYVFNRTNVNGVDEWNQTAYIKASNTQAGDTFGFVGLSGDGLTLAIGADGEDSSLSGIVEGTGLSLPVDESAIDSGAVYVFGFSNGAWIQEAYIKTSNLAAGDGFGSGISLSNDGDTLAVSAPQKQGGRGAAYVFKRDVLGWVEQEYIQPEIINSRAAFGESLSLSGDGNVLAVGATGDEGSAIGLNGDPSDNNFKSGAAYIFTRDGEAWLQQAYIKASNPDANDFFGNTIKLSNDGKTLAISASREDSIAVGINGGQSNNDESGSGAIYLY